MQLSWAIFSVFNRTYGSEATRQQNGVFESVQHGRASWTAGSGSQHPPARLLHYCCLLPSLLPGLWLTNYHINVATVHHCSMFTSSQRLKLTLRQQWEVWFLLRKQLSVSTVSIYTVLFKWSSSLLTNLQTKNNKILLKKTIILNPYINYLLIKLNANLTKFKAMSHHATMLRTLSQ